MFGERCSKALAPGMIGSGDGRGSDFVERLVEMFSRDDLRLPGLLVEDGERQRFAIIQDEDLFVGIDTNGDLGIAQSIGRAFRLDLVDGLVKLKSEVFGEGTRFLPGENAGQLIFGGQRAMGIDITSGLFGETLVEICQELG